jgi:hypothetical protein
MTPTSAASTTTDDSRPRRVGSTFAVAAVVAWLAMVPVGFLYAASGLLVPGPWLFLMWLLYAAALAATVLLTRRRSYWVLVPPVVGAAAWFALVSLGEAYWGWTA